MMREFAWRIFAGELNSSDFEHSEGGERAPTYLITPLGARVNRLLAVGVLTELENLGDVQEPMWKARISDPTGTFYVSAGQYQMEAAAVLSKLKPPAFVSVMGKSRVYSPEEGVVYISVRPEIVKEVDSYFRDYWILEACKSLKTRLDAVREALKLEEVTKDKLMALGFRKELSEGIELAKRHYKEIPLERFEELLIDALRYLLEEDSNPDELDLAKKSVQTGDNEEGADKNRQEIILQVVEELDKDGKGASWEDVVSNAKKRKIAEEELEELTNALLEDGKIYEPVLGKIKRA
jgi:RPA family protein